VRWRWLIAVVAISAAVGVSPARAQTAPAAVVQVESGPHFKDVATQLQVVVDGFEQSPQPDIELDSPEHAELELVGVTPSVSSYVESINGQMRRWQQVRFIYRYRLVPRKAGMIKVGPFKIRQGPLAAATKTVSLRVGDIPSSDQQLIKLVLPPGPLWVGRPVQIDVEWWVSEELGSRIGARQITVPAFDQSESFHFVDIPTAEAQMEIAVQTAKGTKSYPALGRRETRNGEPYFVFTIARKMIPLRAGTISVKPTTIVTEEVMRWQRNVFGDRIPSATRRIQASDNPQTIEVRDAPVAGRQNHWTGAVGKGLTVSTQISRSVGQVGDPIELTIRISGDAVLNHLALPPPDAMGLDAAEFRVSADSGAGTINGDTKEFKLIIRARGEHVREIPPLTVSWFDPDLNSYEQSTSEPIALSVRAAEVISGADVVRQPTTGGATGQAVTNTGGDAKSDGQPSTSSKPDGRSIASDLSQADLAIETSPEHLGPVKDRWYQSQNIVIATYGAAALALVVGAWFGRRRKRDPATVAAARMLREMRTQLKNANDHSSLAEVLRDISRSNLIFPRQDLTQLLGDCETVVFAPDGGTGTPLSEELVLQAKRLGEQLRVPS
jgi:hypothetical protein